MPILRNSVCSAVITGDINKGHELKTVVLAMGTELRPILSQTTDETVGVRLQREDADETIEIPVDVAETIWAYVETLHDPPRDPWEGEHPHDFGNVRAESRRDAEGFLV